jgi:pilus assembly protein CpaB
MNRLTPARLSMVMFMVVGGLIAAYIAKGLLAVEEKRAAPAPLRNIPMAISDLPAGTLVTDAHLGLGPVLPSKMSRDVLLSNKSIVGRVTKEAISAAEPIHSSMLYEKGVYPNLKVRKGMQAVTIMLGSAAIVDGLVKPGQFVDVHFTPSSLAGDQRVQGGMTMTLFKGIKIVTINRQLSQGVVPGNDSNSVTLELTSEQANILLVAKDKGSLYFSFNPEGQGTGGLALTGKDRATLEEILGLQPIPKPPAPPAPFIALIYRGAGRRQYEFKKVGDKYLETGPALPVPLLPTGQGAGGQNATGQNGQAPQQPGAPGNGAPGNGAGGNSVEAPPAPGYDPGIPAPPVPANPPTPPQPAASTEKLF